MFPCTLIGMSFKQKLYNTKYQIMEKNNNYMYTEEEEEEHLHLLSKEKRYS